VSAREVSSLLFETAVRIATKKQCNCDLKHIAISPKQVSYSYHGV
jgi:hypothetical protein